MAQAKAFSTQASQRAILRPKKWANAPATCDDKKASKREKRSDEPLESPFYPMSASWYPNMARKPGIACKPAMAAESSPYCILVTATMIQISRHFLFTHKEFSGSLIGLVMVPIFMGCL